MPTSGTPADGIGRSCRRVGSLGNRHRSWRTQNVAPQHAFRQNAGHRGTVTPHPPELCRAPAFAVRRGGYSTARPSSAAGAPSGGVLPMLDDQRQASRPRRTRDSRVGAARRSRCRRIGATSSISRGRTTRYLPPDDDEPPGYRHAGVRRRDAETTGTTRRGPSRTSCGATRWRSCSAASRSCRSASGVFFYWLLYMHPYESTDDAFVDARSISIQPKVGGYVVDVLGNRQPACRGRRDLFQIDRRDYQVALDQAQAQVAAGEGRRSRTSTRRSRRRTRRSRSSKAQVAQSQAALEFAQEDAARYKDLAERGSGTVQQSQSATSTLEQRQASLTSANASVVPAEKQVGSLQAQRASTEASLPTCQGASRAGRTEPRLHDGHGGAGRPGRPADRRGRRSSPRRARVWRCSCPTTTGSPPTTRRRRSRHAARASRSTRVRRLSGPHDPGNGGLGPAGVGHGLQPAAGPERHRQLREGGPAHPGQDRGRRLAEGRRRSARACRSCRTVRVR